MRLVLLLVLFLDHLSLNQIDDILPLTIYRFLISKFYSCHQDVFFRHNEKGRMKWELRLMVFPIIHLLFLSFRQLLLMLVPFIISCIGIVLRFGFG